MRSALNQVIDRFPKSRVLVVGDLMLDRFIWGQVNRISPEAPVPVVRVTRESAHLGGAANVVANLRALGGDAVPIGLIGDDEAGKLLIETLKSGGVSTEGLVIDSKYRTIQKTRIVAHNQQVVRVDREDPLDLTPLHRDLIKQRLTDWAPKSHAMIVSDYGKGVITADILEDIAGLAGNTPVNVDPKDKNFDHYHGFNVLTPNQKEAERMSGIVLTNDNDLVKAAAIIFDRWQCRHLLITRGEQGMALFLSPGEMALIPTHAREVYDVSGAGDTVIATYTLAQSVGATPFQAAVLANAAAGVVVGKLGTASLNPDELKAALSDLPTDF